jgi:hypothetical protein
MTLLTTTGIGIELQLFSPALAFFSKVGKCKRPTALTRRSNFSEGGQLKTPVNIILSFRF